jgi:hypothetical protein
MSKEYTIPSSMKREAEAQARSIGVRPDSTHHICPRSLARKYQLPHNVIVSLDNAIALEQDFHDAIHHGGKFVDQETGEVVEIEAFEEEDYIFLAIALLGLSESDFDARNIHQSKAHRKRKEKTRRRKTRLHRH